MFRKYSLPERRIYIVSQFDHPREITPLAVKCADEIINSGVIINNQTTLLRGVNDDPQVLAELLNGLTAIGINPYYVFQCRPVKRVEEKFQLSLKAGFNIVEQAKTLLNGHSKRFRYVMSHDLGKIEILGFMQDSMLFKYHQAHDEALLGKIFSLSIDDETGWLNRTDPN